ncbi:MAG TPA: energy-coupling factor transporter transmembrane component T [Solirubrobacteraceae bacterium]|nr:energy-coupling factor transporter transmembrane component T [Solirubrobacteraceae bacterium]
MPATLIYRRLASPLHAARATVGAAWTIALILTALSSEHPLVLGTLTLSIVLAGACAGVGPQLVRSLRTAAIVAIPIVVVNVLASRDGLTVFVRLGDLGPFGQGNLTVEALVYGLIIALKVTVIMLATTLASLAVDPDELLRVVRRLSFRSALTASLATRMIPVLAGDAQRLSEAQRTRPASAGGRTRERVRLLSAIVGSSLDRAMDMAATLELRGFAGAVRAPRRTVVWSRHDLAFAISAALLLALTLAARLGSVAAFNAYPQVHAAGIPQALGLSALIAAAVLFPFLDRRGIEP